MLKNQIRKDKKLRGNQRLSPLVFMLCNYDKFVKRNTAFHQKNILKSGRCLAIVCDKLVKRFS